MRNAILSSRPDAIDIAEEIEAFIVSLAERVDALQDAEFKGDLEDLVRQANDLGALADELGFEPLAASAWELKRCSLPNSAEQIRETLIDLTEIAKRVRMGHRGAV
jgi:hypothetical protein